MPAKELYNWLESTRITNVRLAKLLGVSRQSVQLWLAGQAVPGLSHALYLEALSKGAIPLECWLDKEQSSKLDEMERDDALAAG